MIKYREPLWRPPAEINSLIFQVAYGCPNNTCRFCAMFKGVRYEQRPLDDVLDEIEYASKQYPEEKRIFLADGDAMYIPFDDLKAILEKLNECFPRLARVNVYANGSSILTKTKAELKELRSLKLNTLYMGLESGDEELLKLVTKNETAKEMVDAVSKAQDIGFRCSVMVLLGLGGKGLRQQHIKHTAMALNLMQPRLLSFLRFTEVDGIKMFKGYDTVSEYEAVDELYRIIEGLDLNRTVFRSNHSSNPVPLEGRFPQDKERLLTEVKGMLASGQLDTNGVGHIPFWL
jgi:radical SAM superfamily enzyme YgiQ (UPF0313 family)